MNEQARAFQVSLGIHAAFALGVLALSSGLIAPGRPAAFDLSLLSSAPAQAPDRPLHPRARLDQFKAVPLPEAAVAPGPQVERENVSADLAPVQAAPGVAAAEPEQAPGLSRDAVRDVYIKGNFNRIRETIQRGLAYPAQARRMGWSGRVLVSFVVGTDGCVRDVRIVSGCGFETLDRSAVETIKRGAPYPPPPSEVELVMPINYRLE